MKTKSLLARWRAGLAIALTLFVGLEAPAQQQMQKLAQAQQENARALRQYSWKSRTEIRKDGETRSVQLNLMRYDLDGSVQQTPVSSTPQQQLPTRGLRGLIAKKKKESLLELLDDLKALAKSYGELPPEKMQRFMAGATITPEVTAQQNRLRLHARDVLRPGDSMTIWVDAATRKQRRVEVQTTLEHKPVRIVSEFQDLPNGPTYMARSVVDYQGQELTLITENFDYMRRQDRS